jgi:hypothetical protein
MLQSHQIEDLIELVSGLDRDALVNHLLTYRANFPVDFTPTFLSQMELERLRHIFVAMCLQTQRLPSAIETNAPAAA